jgi:hypothetical protein
MFGVVFDEIEKSAFCTTLRRVDLDFVAGSFGERFFEKIAVFEINGDVNRFR